MKYEIQNEVIKTGKNIAKLVGLYENKGKESINNNREPPRKLDEGKIDIYAPKEKQKNNVLNNYINKNKQPETNIPNSATVLNQKKIKKQQLKTSLAPT